MNRRRLCGTKIFGERWCGPWVDTSLLAGYVICAQIEPVSQVLELLRRRYLRKHSKRTQHKTRFRYGMWQENKERSVLHKSRGIMVHPTPKRQYESTSTPCYFLRLTRLLIFNFQARNLCSIRCATPLVCFCLYLSASISKPPLRSCTGLPHCCSDTEISRVGPDIGCCWLKEVLRIGSRSGNLPNDPFGDTSRVLSSSWSSILSVKVECIGTAKHWAFWAECSFIKAEPVEFVRACISNGGP